MATAWRVARLIMEAVPSCDARRIYQAKDSGNPEAVLREANLAGMNGLLGVIRGRVIFDFGRDSQEAGFLFGEVERLRRITFRQPRNGLGLVWDYFESTADRFEVINQIIGFPQKLDSFEADGLIFSDIAEEIEGLRSQVLEILCDVRRIDLHEVQEIGRRIGEIPQLIASVRRFEVSLRRVHDGKTQSRERRNNRKEDRRKRSSNWRDWLETSDEGEALRTAS